jgi:hypothetical protein
MFCPSFLAKSPLGELFSPEYLAKTCIKATSKELSNNTSDHPCIVIVAAFVVNSEPHTAPP